MEFHVVDGQYPEGFDFDGVVVTGSRSSVYDDDPWIEPTKAWVEAAIDRGLPALGICFGHQLLADVLGGTVEDMGEYELGYREIHQTADDPVFDGLDETFCCFLTHSDVVTELPLGAECIAENDHGIQGFRCENVVGIQAHPEYDQTSAEGVTRAKDLPDERIEAVCADITDETYARACETKVVFDNFLRELQAATPAASDD